MSIVDPYTLVFASLLLRAGSLGDRYGRKTALTSGLGVFGIGSLASSVVGSPGSLIATRAVQGFGGAYIMPSTLSIPTNVFPPDERGRAIGSGRAFPLSASRSEITGGYLHLRAGTTTRVA